MIDMVELHFEGEYLPVLNRWRMHWQGDPGTQQEIIVLSRSESSYGRRFHWNLPLMSLCLALLRLESRRGRDTELLSGGKGSAANVLGDCCTDEEAAASFRPVLCPPGSSDSHDASTRLARWFRVMNGHKQPAKRTVIHAGPHPPSRVVAWLDNRKLSLEDLATLETKLEWMAGERDWLGSLSVRPSLARVA